MPLKMAQPWKDPKSGVYHLRQRTPRDLLRRLKGSTVTLPVGESFATVRVGDTVQASLRTRDPREAKPLHATADAALRRYWQVARNGPSRLTQKQTVALAGTLYRGWTEALGDNPGKPETWARVQAANRDVEAGRWSLKIGEEARTDSLEERFGGFADALLRREGLLVDSDSRSRLVTAVSSAMSDATAAVHRMAQDDYSPDPAALRFPAWERPSEAEPRRPLDLITVSDLFGRWSAYQVDKRAASTVQRYGSSFRSLAGFIGDADIREITSDRLHEWAEHRRDREGVTAGSINSNDLVAVSSVFKWALGRAGGKLLPANPATGVRLDEPRRDPTRERTFRAEEVSAILTAANAVTSDRRNPTLTSAFRWTPWLAAYSGARISELTALKREHIRDEAGVPVMDLKSTKTGKAFAVPLHPHLIEMGFLDFVKGSSPGPLFYDPKRHGAARRNSPATLRSGKVAAWVRKVAALDMAVDPNHGWRHTWKTRALGAGIEERIRDAITGHGVRSVARGYETPDVATLADAMARFPRYSLQPPSPDPRFNDLRLQVSDKL